MIAAPELLAASGSRPATRCASADEPFTIAGTVLAEPDDLRVGLAVGPRLFLSLAGLDRAGLVQTGSRIHYRALVRMPPGTSAGALAAAVERLRDDLAPRWRVESWREAQPSLRQGVARVDRFLGLVALLSLLVGGIGVAQTVRAWLADRFDAIAILKCLGMRPREVLALYLAHTLLLGLAGSLLGIAAGVAVQLALPHLFPDLLPVAALQPFQPAALARGLLLGLGVAVLFSVPPLVGALRVPPARVLRRDARPLPLARGAYVGAGAALVAGVAAMATLQAHSLRLGLEFAGGLIAAALLLAGAARLLVAAVGRLPVLAPALRERWRQALDLVAARPHRPRPPRLRHPRGGGRPRPRHPGGAGDVAGRAPPRRSARHRPAEGRAERLPRRRAAGAVGRRAGGAQRRAAPRRSTRCRWSWRA